WPFASASTAGVVIGSRRGLAWCDDDGEEEDTMIGTRLWRRRRAKKALLDLAQLNLSILAEAAS
ncbi:MAG: hypothetical protein RIQ95_2046, partial [Pseudomonadota bacterium]